MATTTTPKRKHEPETKVKQTREHVVSIRLEDETLRRLGEIATEMDRSKSSVLTRAVREYVDREYAVLEALRESDRDFAEGRTVSNDELKVWAKAAGAGQARGPRFSK